MLKIPKAFKYKKSHKGNLKNTVLNNYTLKNELYLGRVGLKALESGRITPNHLHCCKQLLNKTLKKVGQIRFSVFPQTSVTKKPLEVRMGKGKGAVHVWVVNISSGTTLVEVEGTNLTYIVKSLNSLKKKLPIQTKLVYETQL